MLRAGGPPREGLSRRRPSRTGPADPEGMEPARQSPGPSQGAGRAVETVMRHHQRQSVERVRVEARRLRRVVGELEARKMESLAALAGGTAHHLNNLLRVIMGNADLALDDLPPRNPARRSIEEIRAAADRAAALGAKLLACSGSGYLRLVSVDLNALVREEVEPMSARIPPGVRLRSRLGVDLPPVKADPRQLRQVVRDLIENAVEAIGDRGGDVVASAAATELERAPLSCPHLDYTPEPGTYVVLEVNDTGSGMRRETKARAFDPFFTTKAAGRGLGLTTVLGVVRGCRGAAEVASSPGRGTCVRVYLPTAPLASVSPRFPPPAASERSPGILARPGFPSRGRCGGCAAHAPTGRARR